MIRAGLEGPHATLPNNFGGFTMPKDVRSAFNLRLGAIKMNQKSPEDRVRETLDDISSDLFALTVPSDARHAAFNKLFFNRKQGWRLPFWLMLMLGAGLAALGLSQSSAATIIGTMIIAPLGQPIIALGAAVALGWPAQFLRLLGLIALGALSVISLSYLLGFMLSVDALNSEILLRTAPDLRDLAIAVFAGTAGAFGYFRPEFSTVLSGVAVAVALVPPLCVTGLMLEDGRFILAAGSTLLFVTNLVGIWASAVLVFFVSGVAHAEHRRGWFVGGTIVTILALVLIVAPLVRNINRAEYGTSEKQKMLSVVEDVLKNSNSVSKPTGLNIEGGLLTITLRPAPIDPGVRGRMVAAVQDALGFQVELRDALQ